MTKQRQFKGLSKATQTLLRLSPNEHSFLEFKENAKSLKPRTFVALANAAALAGEPHATLLVGVTEAVTHGVSRGEICGLDQDLHKVHEAISQSVGDVRPSPPQTTVYEENVRTEQRLLRVEITPTFVPHFDKEGRRITRQGPTTRAMSDEEVLQLFALREQHYSPETSGEPDLMMGDLRIVQEDVLDEVRHLGFEADQRHEESRREQDREMAALSDAVAGLGESVESIRQGLEDAGAPESEPSMESVWLDLRAAREHGALLLALALDEVPPESVPDLDALIRSPIDLQDFKGNLVELRAWQPIVGPRPARARGEGQLSPEQIRALRSLPKARTAEDLLENHPGIEGLHEQMFSGHAAEPT